MRSLASHGARNGVLAAALTSSLLLSSPAAADPPRREDITALTARIERSPGDVRLLLLRAELYLSADRVEEALDDLRLVEAIAPDEPRLLLLRAEAAIEQARWREAEAMLDTSISRGDGTQRAYALRARLHERFDRELDAIADYDAALSFGGDLDLFLARGQLQEALGLSREAIEGYEAGLREHAGAIVLRVALIRVLVARGDLSRALAHVDAAAAQSRVDTKWLLLRGSILEAMGRSGEARRAREAALAEAQRLMARRPSAMALAARGEAFLALGRTREAIADLEQATVRAPRMTEARALLAEARRRAEGGAR